MVGGVGEAGQRAARVGRRLPRQQRVRRRRARGHAGAPARLQGTRGACSTRLVGQCVKAEIFQETFKLNYCVKNESHTSLLL